jgi:protocatechuate 3,4-dioxygenase beta subunit
MQNSLIHIALLLVVGPGIVVLRGETPSDIAEQPSNLTSTARIAPKKEPGTPLVISGRVVEPDGKTPVPGAMVYAYHTDAEGNYGRTGESGEAGESHPRLRG